MNGISALLKEDTESSFAPSIMWGHSDDKMVTSEPGGKFSPDTKSVCTSIFHFSLQSCEK